jgi:hypothetical protein
MTAPIEELVPLKYKTWIAAVGSVVSFVAPLALSVSDALPSPWPAVIGVVLSLLTALGVYKAPYKPADAVLVPEAAVPAPVVRLYAPQVPFLRRGPA